MSGGRLVVVDRLGRDVKRFPLARGMVTLGSDLACDIRVMLPSVYPHHATVVVHANQTVVRNVCEGETLVNGRGVSVAALRHGDVISIGGRHLRWEYSEPAVRRPQAPEPALLAVGARGGGAGMRRGRRGSLGARAAARERELRLAIEMSHRASMPGSAGGKQVAIVQPQRRDTSDNIEKNPPRTPVQSNKRPRTTKSELDTSFNDAENEKKRKCTARGSPAGPGSLHHTTQATLWIEARKTAPRRAASAGTTSLRRSAGPSSAGARRRARSAHAAPAKIQPPLTIDHTKQAALLQLARRTAQAPRRATAIIDVADSNGRNSSVRSTTSRRSVQKSPKKSPSKTSPRKSALRDPSAKRGSRKTESIKFDLSNLDQNHSQEDTDVVMLSDATKQSHDGDSASDTDITLRYSESPSPRRSIHARRSYVVSESDATTLTPTPHSPRATRSSRGTIIIQKALNDTETLSYSRRTTKSMSDKSRDASVATAFRTRTLSSRTPRKGLESYSIVDLVSDESGRSTSVYDSAGSIASTTFITPQNSTGRKTRSSINPTLLGSSTPYIKGGTARSRSDPSPNTTSKTMNSTQNTTRSSKSSRRSKSLSTPENTDDAKKHISVNSTRISRASRSRSRLNDSDLLLLDDNEDSPRTSKRISTTSKSTRSSVLPGSDVTPTHSPAQNEGTSTPENRHSPEEASTPVLSIQSLLDSSQSSLVSQRSTRKGRPSFNTKRKTIGGIAGPKTRIDVKSKSMNFSARKTRLRLSSDSVEALNKQYDQDNSEIVTPKSAVKLVQVGVKNKHSTAKKPQSKRSIIDDLNESDIVKQLFNSPVKRKLSQSMTEFSRKQLSDDDDSLRTGRRTRSSGNIRTPANRTTDNRTSGSRMADNRTPASRTPGSRTAGSRKAASGTPAARTPDGSLYDHTDSYTPEMFVSPISTPRHSPNLEGIKLLFAKTTPENDLRNVRGVKELLRTPRTRRSIKNDLTDVSGVKNVFAKSPKNRLSDVRVKEVFASSPKDDLTRVSGVKSLFRSTKKRKSPRNELDDIRGVKKLFKKNSPANDLRNVSGVKRTLRKNSPKNDLTDVRGVKRMFRREKRNDLNDVSGVEELFNVSNESHRDTERLFDELIGKPPIKAVYSKSFTSKADPKPKRRKAKSLHTSLDVIVNNVEDWLQQELNKCLHKPHEESTSTISSKSKANMTRELKKLVTETVEGNTPIRTSRIRNATIVRSNESDMERKKSASEVYSAHTLPIKKRSLVEASMDKSNDNRAILPIKKRAVVHSTPVKGRVNLTMNASVLGRVSPIVAVDETQYNEQDASIRSIEPKETTEAVPKTKRGTRAKPENLEIVDEFVKPSPKKTRGKAKMVSPKTKPVSPVKEKAPAKAQKASSKKAKKHSPIKEASPSKSQTSNPAKILASPVAARTTRSRRKDVSIPESNTKKRAATVVVTKKSPVMSPQPRVTRKQKEPEPPSVPKISPKKTRATRRNESVQSDKPKTPKITRAKVQKATVVISKPSPQIKPRPTKTRAQADLSDTKNTKKNRKTVTIPEAKPESPKKSQVQQKSTRKTRTVDVQSSPKTRGRKTVNDVKENTIEAKKPDLKSKKGHKVDEEEDRPARKNTRNNKQEEKIDELKTVKIRGKRVNLQESVESAPTTRGRRAAKPSTVPEDKSRKRKSSGPDNEIPPKIAKSKEVAAKGKMRESDEKTDSVSKRKKSAVKDSKAEKAQSEVTEKRTRGKRAEVEPVKATKKSEPKTTRGKKNNIENVSANQVTGKRKRATVTEPLAAQADGRLQQRGHPAAARAARGAAPADGKTASRSRRR